jgi:cardiolipin synthase (CMP-forming)
MPDEGMQPTPSDRILTIPNLLSLVRLALIPLFLGFLLTKQDPAALATLIAASVTDFLDGYLARHAHAQSRFGRIVDPLADRLLINLAIILLVYHQRLDWWLAAPVLLRDALLAAVFRARHESTEVRVNLIGKTATASIMLSLMLLMLVDGGWPKAVYGIGVALSVVAGVRYLREPQGGLESRPS